MLIPVGLDTSGFEEALATMPTGAVAQTVHATGAREGLKFAGGGTTPAHITRTTRIKYGEPETGGEAYVPRRGDRTRNLQVLETAASWHGARVAPMRSGGIVPWRDDGPGGAMGGGGGVSVELGVDYDRLATVLEARSASVTIERGDRLDEAAVARIVTYIMKARRVGRR